MIGYYNYSVILTYISLASSIFGMMITVDGHYKSAVIFLAFSGLCDMFDGKIARSMKNRSEDAKKFGIQIDSLCDIVCFGVFPVILCYKMGMNTIVGIMILVLYATNGVIRLGYFNVIEEKRQEETEENRKFYQGLPITSISVALPLLYMFKPLCKENFIVLVYAMMLTIAILFVTDFRFKKPHNEVLAAMVAIVSMALANMFIFHWI